MLRRRLQSVTLALVLGTLGSLAGPSSPASASTDDQFVIMARTDALAVEGLDAALERAEAYLACGVDALFIEAVRSDAAWKGTPILVLRQDRVLLLPDSFFGC